MSRTAIVAGDDEDGLGDALETEGVSVKRVEGAVTAERLREAGIEAADLFVLTDLAEATAISLVKELAPETTIVVYSRDSLPEFAKGQTDLAVDPALLAPDVVAEELA